ncbi:indolepyruvate oxidoreductase subunit beta [Oxyplasma meridianum]|uniref:Indolepyruvate oxidoreductase subunit beta n=1 Tax=Oxyplasma meridianum TaxID=3073602 RepID=A0AAX4NGX9_9ARCH
MYNIRLAGVGGQGIITAGTIVSEAAKISGKKVIMSEIHGLSQRGGSVTVDVRMGEVYGPIIPMNTCDLIFGLEMMESFRSMEALGKVKTALISTEKLNPISLSMQGMEYPSFEELVEKHGKDTVIYPVDAVSIAVAAGSPKSVNTVMIGIALGLNLIPLGISSVTEAMKSTFSEKNIGINTKALKLGLEWAGRMKNTQVPGSPERVYTIS